ncbi:MAG: hypothetical protein IT371_31940 [Deltaproteobacteria bacterium]|nr:hypothetical protein [Deltaproteobacteria bacterium]
MISYEDLCQALDRYKTRQGRAAELAALERTEPAPEAAPPGAARGGARGAGSRAAATHEHASFGADSVAEDTNEIDVDEVVD